MSFVCTLIAVLFLYTTSFAQTQTFKSGSAIIDMGSATPTVKNSLKPYGLVYALLKNNNVPVNVVVNANKVKDGIDFTYNGKGYKGGTFIISAEYITSAVTSVLNSWRNQGVLIDDINSDLTVDVTYKINFIPKWALDKTNGSIAVGFMNAAGIPSSAYGFKTPAQLGACDDIFILPHADPSWANHSNLLDWNRDHKSAIWAGCHAVSVLENLVDPNDATRKMNFLSTNGLLPFTDHNRAVTPVTTLLPGDPIAQYLNNTTNAQLGGSETVYLPKIGSAWRTGANGAKLITTSPNQSDIPGLSPGEAVQNLYGRAFGDAARGYVAYQASHNFGGSGADQIAAQRIFFNFSLFALNDKIPPKISVGITGVPTQLKALVTSPQLNSNPTGTNTGGASYVWTSTIPGTFLPNSTSQNVTFRPDDVGATAKTAVISCKATDNCGRVTFDSKSLTVIPATPPLTVTTINKSIADGCVTESITFNVFDSNIDANAGARTLISVTNLANGTVITNTAGSVTFTPTAGYKGTTSGQYTISNDGGVTTAVGNINISVGDVLNLPAIVNDNATAIANSIVQINVLGNDKNDGNVGTTTGSNLYIRDIPTKPSKGYVYINVNGTLSYLSQNLPGVTSDQFTYQACNTVTGYCQTGTVSITLVDNCGTGKYQFNQTTSTVNTTLTPTADAYMEQVSPTANYGTASTLILRTTSGNVQRPIITFGGLSSSISSTAIVTNAQLIMTSVNGFTVDNTFPIGAAINVAINPVLRNWSESTVTYNTFSGALTWTSVGAANTTNDITTTGNTTFPQVSTTVVAAGGTLTATVTTMVQNWLSNTVANNGLRLNGPANRANPITFYSKEDGTASRHPKLSIDYYPCLTTPTTYIPIVYPESTTTSSALSVTISPLTNDLSYYTGNNTQLTITSISSIASGSSGGLTSTATIINAGTQIVYTPRGNFVGTDTIRYVVTDGGNGTTNSGTIRITVTRVAPTIVNDNVTTNSNTAITINIGANDVDLQGALTAPTLLTFPANGTATLVGNTVVYTPTTGFVGTETFTYRRFSVDAPDACSVALSGTATITVTVANQPPVAVNDSKTTFGCTPVNIDIKANDTDPENKLLTVTIVTGPANGVLTTNADGTYKYTPNNNFIGTDQFTYTVADPSAAVSNQATVTITVSAAANPNVAPSAVADTDNTLANQLLYTNVLSNDSDPNSDAFTLSISATGLKAPTSGTIQIMTNNLIRYTPNANFVGTDTYQYQITDTHPTCGVSSSLSSIALVTISVTAVPTTLSGTVYNDVDISGQTDFSNIKTGAEVGTNANGSIYVYLIDNNNVVKDRTVVDVDGTYTLSNVPSLTSNLKLILSDQDVNVDGTLTAGTLPTGYSNSSPLIRTLPTTTVADMGPFHWGIYTNAALSPGVIVAAGNLCGANGTPGTILATSNATGGSITSTRYFYQWESSTTSATTGFAATSAADTLTTYTATAPITATTFYRRSVVTRAGASNTNINGPLFSNVVTVELNPTPTVTASTISTTIAVGGSATLTAAGANTYAWSPATGLSATNTAVVTASPVTTTSYTVTGTAVSGCVSSATITITVIEPGVIGGDQNGCGTFTPTTLTSGTEASGAAGITYQWQSSTTSNTTDFTNIVGATGSTYSPGAVSTTTFYKRVVIAGVLSFNSNVVTVTVNTIPTVTASTISTTIAVGGNATLTAAGANTYAWSPSTALSATNTAVVTASPVTTTAYTVTGTALSGCVSSTTITITVIEPGVIGGDQNGCGTFTPTTLTSGTEASGATGITYQWQSSTTSNTTGFTNIVGATGSTYSPGAVSTTTFYRRVATVGAFSFNSNVVTTTVNVLPVVTAGSNSPVCIGGALTVTASGGFAAYSWTGPNNFTAVVQNAGITTTTALSAGNYTVEVTDVNGCKNTATTTVVINTLPVITITPATTSIQMGTGVSLTASGANTYGWTPTTGLSVANTAVVTASPLTTTQYTVTGTNTVTGCVTTATITVTVLTIDAVNDDFTATEINGAKGGTTATVLTNDKLNNVQATLPLLNLTLNSNGGIAGLAFDANAALVVPANTFEGTYTVTYTICEKANPTNCDQATVLIKVGRGLSLTATAICKNDVPYIQYTVVPNFTPGTNPVTLTWLNTDKTVLTAQTAALNQPLQTEILWPGAAVDGQGRGTDWPGWFISNGQWVQGADGFEKARPDAYLVITVNPTDTIKVSYPPATPGCNAVPPTILITLIPGSITANQTICVGATPAAFTSVNDAGGGNGAITYQWQQSTDSLVFTNITGATANTYAAPALSQKTFFRRVATTAANGSVFSNVVSVTTVAPPVIGGISGPCALQKDSTKTFSVSAAIPAATNYVWTLPAGYTGSSTTNSINVKAGTANGVISVRPFNGGCAGNTVNYNVAIIDYAKVTIGGVPVTASGNNNNPVTVTVTLFDPNGNRINCSGGVAVINLCTTNPGSFTTVIDNNNGTYTAQLTAPANELEICGTVGGIPIVAKTKVTFSGPQGGIKGNGPILVTETPKLTFTMTAGRSPYTIIYKSAKSNKTDTLTNYVSGTATGVVLIPSTTLYTLVSIIDANGERRDNNFNRDTATIIVLSPRVIITLKSDQPKMEKDSSWATRIVVKTKNIGDLDLSNSQARLNLKDVFPSPVTYILDSVKVSGITVVPNRNYDGIQSTDLFARVNKHKQDLRTTIPINDALGMLGMAVASPDGTTHGNLEMWSSISDTKTETGDELRIVEDGHSIYMFGVLSSLPIGVEADIILWLHVKPNGFTEPFVMQAVALGTGSTEGATALATSISNDNEDVSTHPEITKKGDPVPTVINLFPTAAIGVALTAGTPVLQGNGTYNVLLSYKLKNYGNVNLKTVKLFQNLARVIGSPSTFSVVGSVTATNNIIVNPAFDAKLDTNMILSSSVLGYKQESLLQFTINITPNQLSSVYRLQAIASGFSDELNTTATDLSNDGTDPDPDGNNIPSEKVITVIVINTPVPPLVPGSIGIQTGPTTTVLAKSYCGTTTGVVIIPTTVNSGGLDTYLYQWQSSSDNISFKDIIGSENSTYTTGQVNNSFYLRRATISGSQIKFSNAVFVQIFTLPAKPVITGTATQIVGVGNVTLTSTLASAYSWSTAQTTRSILVTTPGNYTVTITDANGCTAASDAYAISTLDPGKVADIQKTLSKPPVLQQDGSYLLSFNIIAKNLRPELLDSVKIRDDLSVVFPSTTSFGVVDIKASGKLLSNGAYDGKVQIDLLSDVSQLAGAATDSVQITIKVFPNGFAGTLNNVATLTAKSPFGRLTVSSNDPLENSNPAVRVPTKFVLPLIDIFIPSGFSPNQDGTNDKFVITRPFNTNINLEVFNRWGNLVYKAADYKNEFEGKGNQPNRVLGEDLPDGTYYYVVLATDKNTGTVRKFAGFITLKR